jgi:FAD:protein FMN transferase
MSRRQASGFIFSLLFPLLLPSHPVFAEEAPGILLAENRALMGTDVAIKAIGDDRRDLEAAVDAAFSEISRLEQMMSNFIQSSELSRINQEAGKVPVAISRELFSVIRRADDFSRLTDGAFDITFASVGKLWNFRSGIVPPRAAVKGQLAFVDYREIRYDENKSTVFLPDAHMEIGLGGIGKGYAVDRAMAVLARHGVRNAIIMAGGDTLIKGKKGKDLWQVGLRDPDKKNGLLAVLPLEDQAISTSGDYERYFIKDGVRYHHILDTRTGYPAEQCRSVTILAKDATTSDALATGVFVLGPDRGMALIERLDGVEAIIVDAREEIHLSSGLTSLGTKGAEKGK